MTIIIIIINNNNNTINVTDFIFFLSFFIISINDLINLSI